ncbi:MAG: DnaA regulatory inactivator Hda [Gammaproteobacteria bacterium]|jgi:DnaA family protein
MQLALPLGLRDDATFNNFYEGVNTHCVNAVKMACLGKDHPFIYLWGQSGAGRSHLLQAACHLATQNNRSCVYLPLRTPGLSVSIFHDLEHVNLVCIDDVEAIAKNKSWEEGLFHLYNRIRDNGQTLLIAGAHPPQRLGLELPDLVSRLAWGVVFQLHLLSDEDKFAALALRSKLRGLVLTEDVGQFLLRRCPRDMTQLFSILDTLDKASLQAQRKLTIPFVKSVLGV